MKITTTQVAASTPFDPAGTAYDSSIENVQAALGTTQQLAAVGRYAVTLQNNGTISNGTFIGYDSLIPGDSTPIVIPRDSVLKDFTFSNSKTNADYTLDFRKNSIVATPFFTVSQTNTQVFTVQDINESFLSGDQLYIEYIDDGTNATDAVIVLFFQNV